MSQVNYCWFSLSLQNEMMKQADLLEEMQYLLQNIKDPQFTHQSLADLHVITPSSISVHQITTKWGQQIPIIEVRLRPTTPHCHLALHIGLAIRLRLKRQLPCYEQCKVRVLCQPGSHLKQQQIQKQLNDKQRIAAAFENKQIMEFLLPLVQQ